MVNDAELLGGRGRSLRFQVRLDNDWDRIFLINWNFLSFALVTFRVARTPFIWITSYVVLFRLMGGVPPSSDQNRGLLFDPYIAPKFLGKMSLDFSLKIPNPKYWCI